MPVGAQCLGERVQHRRGFGLHARRAPFGHIERLKRHRLLSPGCAQRAPVSPQVGHFRRLHRFRAGNHPTPTGKKGVWAIPQRIQRGKAGLLALLPVPVLQRLQNKRTRLRFHIGMKTDAAAERLLGQRTLAEPVNRKYRGFIHIQ